MGLADFRVECEKLKRGCEKGELVDADGVACAAALAEFYLGTLDAQRKQIKVLDRRIMDADHLTQAAKESLKAVLLAFETVPCDRRLDVLQGISRALVHRAEMPKAMSGDDESRALLKIGGRTVDFPRRPDAGAA